MQMEGQQNPPVFRPASSVHHKPKKKGKGVEGSATPQVRKPPTLSTLLERLTQAKQVTSQPVPQNVQTPGNLFWEKDQNPGLTDLYQMRSLLCRRLLVECLLARDAPPQFPLWQQMIWSLG